MSFLHPASSSLLGALRFDPRPYNVLYSILTWLLIFGGSVILILLVALLAALAVKGTEGVSAVFGLVADGFRELFGLSFRRIFALATLTFKEAYRRKTLLVGIVFGVLFMFAGWFLQGAAE